MGFEYDRIPVIPMFVIYIKNPRSSTKMLRIQLVLTL